MRVSIWVWCRSRDGLDAWCVRGLLPRIGAARNPRLLEAAGFPPNQEDEDEDEDLPPDVTHDRALFLAMAETLRDQIEEILATGCVIKDVESGLVDWPALYEGREIWLCWKYGEQEVGYWHELNSGFAGRRPVSELQQSGDPKSPPRM